MLMMLIPHICHFLSPKLTLTPSKFYTQKRVNFRQETICPTTKQLKSPKQSKMTRRVQNYEQSQKKEEEKKINSACKISH